MDCNTTGIRATFLVGILALTALEASLAFARDASLEKSAIEMTIHEDVANIIRGDVKTVVAACAPAHVCGRWFPPHAWQTCRDWWRSYI